MPDNPDTIATLVKPRKIVITMRYRIPAAELAEAIGVKGHIKYASYDWLTEEVIIDTEED